MSVRGLVSTSCKWESVLGGGVPNGSTWEKSEATLKILVQCRRWLVEMDVENRYSSALQNSWTKKNKKKLGSGHSKYPKRAWIYYGDVLKQQGNLGRKTATFNIYLKEGSFLLTKSHIKIQKELNGKSLSNNSLKNNAKRRNYEQKGNSSCIWKLNCMHS